jgi:hypothetical protein
MPSIAELLERKRTLIERRQERSDSEHLATIDHDLKEIDNELDRLESKELDGPPIAPH